MRCLNHISMWLVAPENKIKCWKNNTNEFWGSWLGWNRFSEAFKNDSLTIIFGFTEIVKNYLLAFLLRCIWCRRSFVCVFFSKTGFDCSLAWYLLLNSVPLAKSSNNNRIRRKETKKIYEKCLLYFCKYYSTNSIVYITTIKSLFASMLCKSPHTILVDV